MKCRFCNTALDYVFIDLGESPLSNSFVRREDLNRKETFYPLKVLVCEKCFLVQIDEYKKAEEIFDSGYVYFSSFSSTWLSHCKLYTEMMIRRFRLDRTSSVFEIASNDGYLLQYFKEKNIPVLGIEPTANTAAAARKRGISTIVDFFGVRLANELVSEGKQPYLLLGNNVLAHVPDINDFVKGMKIVLDPDGLITMEFPHLVKLIENNQFDTVYHEHFSYLSFTTVNTIFDFHELELFDVEEIPTHGGSLRIFAKHRGCEKHKVTKHVERLLNREKECGITDIQSYGTFQSKAQRIKSDFRSFLETAIKEGKKICGYGAAAKGNTLLNFCEINSDIVSFVADASPHKQGLYLPGSKIPVVAEAEIRNMQPDLIIVLPWNLRSEISEQLAYIRDWGGMFVVAIPEVEVF